MVHIMLELEYVLPLLPNPKTYYLLHYFQICLKVGVGLLILGGHITKKTILNNVSCRRFGVERILSL
jgi:hypothetical protein